MRRRWAAALLSLVLALAQIQEGAHYYRVSPYAHFQDQPFEQVLTPMNQSEARPGPFGLQVLLGFRPAENGTHVFATEAVDGVRVMVGGKMVVDAPGRFADCRSEAAVLVPIANRTYPLTVQYLYAGDSKVNSSLRVWVRTARSNGSVPLLEASGASLQIDSAQLLQNSSGGLPGGSVVVPPNPGGCLLYTSDAADEEDSVDLGG
eukprot:TRINITY_DN18346_c0_g1_i1.p1 TRINITY_DN18346_c0_g1~~TRINITY_DN18346_c0_g1_i1.p1  ORF type:complete len:205 (-),score=42.12 TRINITY_DN18346_c0_g1_i1:35-649(-)